MGGMAGKLSMTLSSGLDFIGMGAFTGASGLTGAESDGTQLMTATDFTTWGQFNVTTTANAALAPDGTTTAFSLNEGTATDRHMINAAQSIGGFSYPSTFSIYAKPNGRRYLTIYFTSDTGKWYAVTDLQTGTISVSGNDTGGTGSVTASTAAGANGYTKIIMAVTGGTAGNLGWEISMSNVATFTKDIGSSPSYTGTSQLIYLWRPKVTTP